MTTEQERQLFASKVLAAVGENAGRLRNRSKVTGFMAMKGHRYNRDLMVVGRSVNGWGDDGVLPEDLASYAVAESYSHDILNSVNGDGPCPMEWITDQWGQSNGEFNTRTSAFFRVIRAVVKQLKIADVEQRSWPSHLVWSELYKISPAEGGNPGGILCDIQFEGCKELFELELKTYKPSRLLFLTGAGWASPFLDDFDRTREDVTGFDRVENLGTLTIATATGSQKIRYVVAVHPQSREGGDVPWVTEVCDAFNR